MAGLFRKWFARAQFVRPGVFRRLVISGAFWFLGCALAQGQSAVATTSYGYDEAGNKTSQTDALGRKTAWTIDAKNRVTGRTLPNGARETSSFDNEDNLLTKTTFAGETLSFQYDSNNRLTGEVIPAGAGSNSAIAGGSVVSRYTPSGRLMSRQEQGPTTLGGLQSFGYNADDLLIEAKNPIGQISYSLDATGNVLEHSIPGAGTVKYEYDDAGRLLTAIAADGKQARYTYDEAGRLIKVDRDLNPKAGQPQVLRTAIGYDNAGLLVTISEIKSYGLAGTFVSGQRVFRDPGGVISRIETDRANGISSTGNEVTARLDTIQTFEYDGLARLTRERRSYIGGVTDTRFEYDLAGNRTKKTVTTAAGTEITTYTYDVADRLTQESTSLSTGGDRAVSYTYDGNGNLASRAEPGKVTLYRFDPRNRLIDIRAGGSLAEAQAAVPNVQYTYDADGNRVRKSGAEDRGYLIDVNPIFPQVALETGLSGSIRYVRGSGLIRQIRTSSAGTEDLFPLHGHLGTSLGAVNADGEVVEQIDSDAFGNLDQPSGLKLRHIYAGEYWDQDAQLLYLRARWYDPKIGRFISGDPFEGMQEDPRSLNRYAYAHSNPVHGTDPSGELTLTETGAASNIQATLSNLQADFGFNAIGGALNSTDEPGLDDVAFGMMAVLGPQARVVAKLSKKPKQLKMGSAPDSGVLGDNLRVLGKHPSSSTDQAHHIVAGRAKRAKVAQSILNKHKIDINSPTNGVWLPRSSHCGGHCHNYYEYVNEILRRADAYGGKSAVLAALKDIERDLVAGVLRVHK